MSLRLRRVVCAALALSVTLFAAAAALRQPEPVRHHFRVVFGLLDKESSDWSGSLTVADGEATALNGWHFEGKEDTVKGTTAWKCRTRDNIAPEKRYPVQDAAGKPKGKPDLRPWPN